MVRLKNKKKKRKKIMKRGYLFLAAAIAAASVAATGCKKKEPKQEEPMEQVLTAVTVNDLNAGCYYVKNGMDFFELPVEGMNFDPSRPAETTTMAPNGITKKDANRIVDFVYKDNAIPTLYKNDQLVFKASGNVPSFTWERFNDQGYSIGLYGLSASAAGKIQFENGKSGNDDTSSITTAIAASLADGMTLNNGFVLDKVNGALLTGDNLRDGGIVAGLTKDAIVNCDLYVGTTLLSACATADMRAFTSFERYTTDLYSNSPDGYAIVDIPDYLKSGYYYINNAGLVKYYNVERGTDTTDIKMDEPYYYEDDKGGVMTYYEYMEKTGAINQNTEVKGGASSLEDTPDTMEFNTDITQSGLTFNIAYQYQTKEAETAAKQNGRFPKVILVSPTGTATELASRGSSTDDEWIHMSSTVEGAVAGTWQLRFYNFEDLYRTVSTDIASGNAKSFIQSGNSGQITIHYDESPIANDITITWQNADHAASVIIRTPDGTEYSKEKTPGNLMFDEYGKVVFKLPNLTDGNYLFQIQGTDLGRVWVDNEESVSLGNERNIPDPRETAEDAGAAVIETASEAESEVAGDEGTEV